MLDKKWLYIGGGLVALGALYYLATQSSASSSAGSSSTPAGTVVTPPYYIPTAAYPQVNAGTVPVIGSNGSVGAVNAANYIAAYTANPGYAVPAMQPTIGLIPIISNTGGINTNTTFDIYRKTGTGGFGVDLGYISAGASTTSTHLNQNVSGSTTSNFGQNVTWAPNAP